MKTISIKTAQNVQITFELAALGQRISAYVIDLVIILTYFTLIRFLVNSVFEQNYSYNYEIGWNDISLFFLSLPCVFYSPLTEFITKGQTLGKKALGIRVIKVNGDNANLNEYLIRWLFKGLAFFLLPLEAVVVLVSKRSQRLADIMANTVVVKLQPTYDYTLQQVLKLNEDKNEIEYPEVEQFTASR